MRRRALLTAIAAGSAGLAGCSALRGSDGGDAPTETNGSTETPTATATETPAATATSTPTDDEWRTAVAYETGPRTVAFGRVGWRDDGVTGALEFDRTATADHPARLTGRLENTNDYETTVRVRDHPILRGAEARVDAFDLSASLYAVPTEPNALTTATPTLRRGSDGYWRVTERGSWTRDTVRLAPGERTSLAYALAVGPETEGFPTGTYDFVGGEDGHSVQVWNTERPGPTGESRFAGRSVPSLGEGPTGWYHDADATTKAFLRPSTERLELDGLAEFEFVNHSRSALQCGHWNLHKLVDGEWFHVAPRIHFSVCRGVGPGGRKRWPLRAFNGAAVPCGCDRSGTGCDDGLTRGYLGGGTYAAVVGYGYPEGDSAALVELVGDQIEVVPTADATVERDGDAAVVTTGRYGDGEDPPDATLVLEPAESAERRLIAEQVMAGPRPMARGQALRDALAPVSAGATRVTVRTDADAVEVALGYEEGPRRFRFRGAAYEVRRG
ncbi:MAG: hypothetical protein ABEJ68_09700 [Halobacteriaceae archaeon]